MGNKIYSTLEAYFDCPVNLPDSVNDEFSLELMDSIRPVPLTAQERHILNEYAESRKPDTTQVADTMPRKFSFVKDVLQDAIGDNLVTSIRYRTDRTYLRLWPILNPQYVSYSSSHGLSYKLRFGAEYYFNSHRYFEFTPRLGYNFKYKKPYFTLPLYFNYNPKRNGQVQVIYGNGNRIGNANTATRWPLTTTCTSSTTTTSSSATMSRPSTGLRLPAASPTTTALLTGPKN